MRRTGKNEERALKRVAKSLLAVLMLSGLITLSSCNDNLGPDNPDPNARVLTVRVTVPGMPATKAAAGDVTGVDPESMIYNVQVWMFNHQAVGETDKDGQQAVSYGYVNLTEGWTNTTQRPSGYYDQWTNQTTYEVPMPIPGSIMDRDENDLKFDFYVLANGPSIGSSLSKTSTRAQLKEAAFGVNGTADYFGITAPKSDSTAIRAINGGSATGPGLPISGFFNRPRNNNGTTSTSGTGVDLRFLKKGISITDAEIKENVPVVQITRAVSKLRFVFAKPIGMEGVSITKIEVDGELIPDQTFVFPREDGTAFELPGSATYLANKANVGSLTSADILGVADPLLLRSDCETNGNKTKTAQEYETFLNAAIGTKTSTQRFAYFRESDKPITGKIYYRMSASDTEDKVATFTMAGLANTNFYRNHSWIVYSYFTGGALYIKPIAIPWVDAGSYNFQTPGVAFVSASDRMQALFGYGWTSSVDNTWYSAGKPTEWYFRHQSENGSGYYPWNDWVHSQMISAPGLNLADAPIFANRIELTTNAFDEPLILKLSDTEHFELVIYHSASTEYEVVDDPDGALIPLAVAAEGITYFYVVPKDGTAHENHTVAAYLITANTGQKIPFNAGVFPGSNENTEIFFYSVSQETFKGYYTTLPTNVRAYNTAAEIIEL